VWLADRNHIKTQNEKVNIWKKMSKSRTLYRVFSDVMDGDIWGGATSFNETR